MRIFTDTETLILNRIQKDWPLTETPFLTLAEDIKINEDELIRAIKSLKEEKIIRDISAIFNTDKLGYESSLITFEVSENDVEKAASIINENPGVSHNYLRDHKWNIWFTLAVGDKNTLEDETKILAKKANAKDYLILRNEKLLKIGLMLDVGNDANNSKSRNKTLKINEINHTRIKYLTEEEKMAIYLLQMDLPLETRPFKCLIEKNNLNIMEKRVVQLGETLKKDGIIRRFSAIIKHNKAGYSANAMTAWKLEDDSNSDIIDIFYSVPNISHLYFRTLYPGKWEHRLFAMIHAKCADNLKNIIKKLEIKSGINDYLVLNSIKEFKKKRVQYFIKEFS